MTAPARIGAGGVERLSPEQRRQLLKQFLDVVFVPQRRRLLAYAPYTAQSAQVDSDGYLAQIIAAIVVGVPGNRRRGKSGIHPGDLSDGTEVKSAYRAEQKNGMEDSHVNFGMITREKMTKLFDRERIIVVHVAYDTRGRVKVEVLGLVPRAADVQRAIIDFHLRSTAERPQLQPRLYPDGRRDRLQTRPGSFRSLGAVLLARAVVIGDEVDIDKWAPDVGLPLNQCLDLNPAPTNEGTPHLVRDPTDPDEFFIECMIQHRRNLIPFCESAGAGQNVGFGNLAQHLVSIVTGLPGTGSGARGFDLDGGGEIKLAMGRRGDPLGTEDFPRLNLQHNLAKILAWPAMYPVRILCEDDGLKVKVFQADIEGFREQVDDYFGPTSLYSASDNMQYHSAPTFDDNFFTGLRGDGSARRLDCQVLYCAADLPDGGCVRT